MTGVQTCALPIWIIKVDDNGLQTVEYIESEIRVTQNKLAKRLVETWSLTQDY